MTSLSQLARHFLVLGFLCFSTTSMAIADQTPVKAFSSLPVFEGAKLSPDGNSIAYTMPYKGRKAIVYQNLDGSDRGVISPPEGTGTGWGGGRKSRSEIASFSWANNHALLVRMSAYVDLRAVPGGTSTSQLFVFQREEEKWRWLGKPKNIGTGFYAAGGNELQMSSQHEEIVDLLSDDPEHILVGLDLNRDAQGEVYKVNLKSGHRKKIREQQRSVQDWVTDQTSTVRFGFGYDGDEFLTVFRKPDGDWITIEKTQWGEKYSFLGFSPDPNVIYVEGYNEHGTLGLYTLDVVTGTITDTLYEDPDYDLMGVVHHPVTGYIAGYGYVDDFFSIKYFDKDLDLIQRSLNKVLKDTTNHITGRAKDRNVYLIYSFSDTIPGAYYLFDRDKGSLGLITGTHPNIDITTSSPSVRVDIPARDGTNLPSYLTLPHGTQGPNKQPTVIMPHGGPRSRDDASWNYWAQFYASRGYAVLRPNFRGSEGYGAKFEAAGFNQWGGLMQDDVTDATRWMIEQGYADADRICIVGGSYGGYAALIGVLKEPNLYRCAISVNGVTNLPNLRDHDETYIGGETWGETMGLKETDDKDVSPYHLVDQINTPVLLIAAKDDQRVPYKQSDDLNKKLQRQNKDSQYIELKNGGHSLVTEASRRTMLTETEKFLAKHIGK